MSSNQIQDDVESQILTTEQYNFILKFEKIYETNHEKINWLENSMKYLQIITIISGFLFLVFFSVFLIKHDIFKFSWIIPLVFVLIALLSLALTLNFFLNLTVIYNEGASLASWMSYISVNLAGLNLMIFVVCFFLKLEGIIEAHWKLITIPIYIVIAIFLFYFIFMLPAFIDRETYWDITLIASLILNSLAFMILLNSRLDGSYSFSFISIFVPIWIMNSLFFIYIIYMYCVGKDSFDILNNSMNMCVNVCLAIASIIISTNLDKKSEFSYVIPCVLIMFGYCVFFTDRFLSQFDIAILEKSETKLQ